jgi:hypothetical protein
MEKSPWGFSNIFNRLVNKTPDPANAQVNVGPSSTATESNLPITNKNAPPAKTMETRTATQQYFNFNKFVNNTNCEKFKQTENIFSPEVFAIIKEAIDQGKGKGSVSISLPGQFQLVCVQGARCGTIGTAKLVITDAEGMPCLQTSIYTYENSNKEKEYIVFSSANSFGMNGILTEKQLDNLSQAGIFEESFSTVAKMNILGNTNTVTADLPPEKTVFEQATGFFDGLFSSNAPISKEKINSATPFITYGENIVCLIEKGKHTEAGHELERIFNAYDVDKFIKDGNNMHGEDPSSMLAQGLWDLTRYLADKVDKLNNKEDQQTLRKLADEVNKKKEILNKIHGHRKNWSKESSASMETAMSLAAAVEKKGIDIDNNGNIHLPPDIFNIRKNTLAHLGSHFIEVASDLQRVIERSQMSFGGAKKLSPESIGILTAIINKMEEFRKMEDFQQNPIKYALKLGLNPFFMIKTNASSMALKPVGVEIPEDPKGYNALKEILRDMLPGNVEGAKSILSEIWEEGKKSKKQEMHDSDYYFFLSTIREYVSPKLSARLKNVEEKINDIEKNPNSFFDLEVVAERNALLKQKNNIEKTEELLIFLDKTCDCLREEFKELGQNKYYKKE